MNSGLITNMTVQNKTIMLTYENSLVHINGAEPQDVYRQCKSLLHEIEVYHQRSNHKVYHVGLGDDTPITTILERIKEVEEQVNQHEYPSIRRISLSHGIPYTVVVINACGRPLTGELVSLIDTISSKAEALGLYLVLGTSAALPEFLKVRFKSIIMLRQTPEVSEKVIGNLSPTLLLRKEHAIFSCPSAGINALVQLKLSEE